MTKTRRLAAAGAAASMAFALAACSTTTPKPAGSNPRDAAEAITHIHGLVRDPATGTVVIATHQGAFERTAGEWVAHGPAIDLMGFTVAPDGSWLASGHPSEGVDLPQPVGLIRSTDRGTTWQVQSRAGQSDFHALAAGPQGVLAFDGRLRASSDQRAWRDVAIPAQPHSLAIAPKTGVALATTEQGLLRSADHGTTWSTLRPPALVALVAWADDRTVVGITTKGRIVTSEDAGGTWQAGTAQLPEVSALSASRLPTGQVEVLVVSGTSVLTSVDGGDATAPLT